MSGRSPKKRILVWIIVILIVAALAGVGYFILHKKQGGDQAQQLLAQMEQMIPGLGQETGTSGGLGRDPLASLSIDGIDVVGVLEIPSLNLMVPVTDKEGERPGFVTWRSGSPVQGQFRLTGSKTDVFLSLSKVAPEAAVVTDVFAEPFSLSSTVIA